MAPSFISISVYAVGHTSQEHMIYFAVCVCVVRAAQLWHGLQSPLICNVQPLSRKPLSQERFGYPSLGFMGKAETYLSQLKQLSTIGGGGGGYVRVC